MNTAQSTAFNVTVPGSSGDNYSIVSQSITTSGYPVQITFSGSTTPSSTVSGKRDMWVEILRGATSVGGQFENDGLLADAYLPVSFTVIDTPPAGTYTYSGTVRGSNATFTWATARITIVELTGAVGPVGPTGPVAAASPNYLINGGFDFWQRGTSFSADGYTADRWYFDETGVCNVYQYLPSDTEGLPAGFNYGIRALAATSNDSVDLYQALERSVVIPLRGKTVTFSCYLKMDANMRAQTGAFELIADYSNSTDARASQTTAIGTVTLDKSLYSSWTRASYTFVVPNDAVGLMVGIEPPLCDSSQPQYFMTGAMLEVGSSATDFRRAGSTYTEEQMACYRYYYRKVAESTGGTLAFGMVTNTTTISQFTVFHPVPMRVAPALGSSGASTMGSDDGAAFRVGTAISISTTNSNTHTGFINFSYATALSQYRPTRLFANSNAAAYIDFDAEL
jgi:hypothetical protein